MPFQSRLLGLLTILLTCSAWADQDTAAIAQAKPAADAGAPVIESKAATTGSQCAGQSTNMLQKSLLVVAFPRAIPNSANAGALADADQQLPQLLSQQLINRHQAIVPSRLPQGLPRPGDSSEQLLAQQVQKLAQDQHTQLVLSGEILDMSMAHPEANYNPGLYTRFLNNFFDFIEVKNRFDKRDRLFSFAVSLRDGFTGQSLFTKRYDTYGLWTETGAPGFGSPLFWKTDYGHQIQGLVKKAARDLGDVIQCQPLIAQIDSRPGQTQILLQGGANNGLRKGDTMTLYQLVIQGSETQYAQHTARLVNRDAAIELQEVYPSHSLGVISGTTYLTGQFLAVSP